MKKIVLVIIVFCIIIWTASCEENLLDSNHNAFEINNNENIKTDSVQYTGEKTNSNIFEFTTVSRFFSAEHIDNMQNWCDLLESKYRINIKYNYIFDANQSKKGYGSNEYYNRVIDEFDNNYIGLVKVYDALTVKMLKDESLILPLNHYIINSNEWESLPEEWKKSYTFENNLWALPSKIDSMVTLRFIREDWLENTNISKPVTIDEFYEAMLNFTINDPDKDNCDNTYGLSHNGLIGLEDIFNSFDARLNHEGIPIPVWNPITNIWEDSLLKDESIDCLQFLRRCIENNLFYNSQINSTDSGFSHGYSGSAYSLSSTDILAKHYILENRPDNGEPIIEYIIGLSHYIDNKTTGYYNKYSWPTVLAKNSSNPSSTINIFINNFLLDFDGYMLTSYGLLKDEYTLKDGIIDIRDNISHIRPGVTYDNPLYQVDEVYYSHFKGGSEAYIKHINRITQVENSVLGYNIPQWVINPEVSTEVNKYLVTLSESSINIVNNIINGMVSIEDGLNQYRAIAKGMGMQLVIDELNENIGKTSEQDY